MGTNSKVTKNKENVRRGKQTMADLSQAIPDLVEARKNVKGGDYKGELYVDPSTEDDSLSEEEKERRRKQKLLLYGNSNTTDALNAETKPLGE